MKKQNNPQQVVNQLKMGDPIIIQWFDCYTPESKWLSIEEVKLFKQNLFEVISCGFFDGVELDHICIVQSIGGGTNGGDLKKSHLKNIPTGCIVKIQKLKI